MQNSELEGKFEGTHSIFHVKGLVSELLKGRNVTLKLTNVSIKFASAKRGIQAFSRCTLKRYRVWPCFSLFILRTSIKISLKSI